MFELLFIVVILRDSTLPTFHIVSPVNSHDGKDNRKEKRKSEKLSIKTSSKKSSGEVLPRKSMWRKFMCPFKEEEIKKSTSDVIHESSYELEALGSTSSRYEISLEDGPINIDKTHSESIGMFKNDTKAR